MSDHYMAYRSQTQPPGQALLRRDLVDPILWSAFLTLAVAILWIGGGYLFGTDWPGPRHFAMPTEASSLAPFEAALAVGSQPVGGEVIGKLMVFGILFVSVLTSFHAVPKGGFTARAAASALYSINPFVYGRLHYGQLFVLAAYAAFPWYVLLLRKLFLEPRLSIAVSTAIALSVIGLFSPHILLIAWVLTGFLFLAQLVWPGQRTVFFKRVGPWVLVMGGFTLLIGSYWIAPFISGTSFEGRSIVTTGAGEIAAYATVPDSTLGLVPNVLGLYGFWAENLGRFTPMKAFVPAWPLILVVVLLVCGFGAFSALKERRSFLAIWVAGLILAGAAGLLLEMGVSQPLTAGLVTWLDIHFAFYRGMRDAGKWAALLALVYSQLFGLSADSILNSLTTRIRNPVRAEWISNGAAALLLALPLAYGNGLLFGAHGEIRPSAYPNGWYAADRLLLADPNHGRALFLPWHEYMHYSFIKNQNSVVASPAPTFFSVPILASQDPEVAGIAPPATPDQEAVRGLVAEGSNADWAGTLARLGVKYVLVDKDLDWQTYSYLDAQAGFTKVADLGSILLYRNGEADSGGHS